MCAPPPSPASVPSVNQYKCHGWKTACNGGDTAPTTYTSCVLDGDFNEPPGECFVTGTPGGTWRVDSTNGGASGQYWSDCSMICTP